ncbi:hypothetical protein BDN70DRAFT_915194 [Pholiota conissans]|uniref:Cupredoxin n=1 Tax=Pholiota conissans TaxID=109636 RepID=A0A9P6CVG6_9AGAR|nr:hypothetical protein BDN70DRAFT_915194 [Pholiota conissans]
MIFTAGFTALAFAFASAASAQMTIQVGAEASSQGGIFQYTPNTISAPNGTVVTFQFSGAPGNHSVTQSSFTDPCNPLAGGFDSGWLFLSAAATPVPEWNLTITDDTKPIWFYCKQLSPSPHCGAGMVGAINAPTTGNNTFAAFQKAAVAFKGASGQGVGALVGVGASASADIGPIPSGATLFGTPSTANPTATSPSTGSGTTSHTSGTTTSATTTHTSSASSLGASFLSMAMAAILGITFA